MPDYSPDGVVSSSDVSGKSNCVSWKIYENSPPSGRGMVLMKLWGQQIDRSDTDECGVFPNGGPRYFKISNSGKCCVHFLIVCFSFRYKFCVRKAAL